MNDFEWLLGSLPLLPRQPPKMSGRLEANKYAMPRLPRHAPTQNNVKGVENDYETASGEGGWQEIKSAAETEYQVGNAFGLFLWRVYEN